MPKCHRQVPARRKKVARMAGARVDSERITRLLGHKQFLAPSEVARIARVSKMSIYRLIHSGEMRAAKVGCQFRIPRGEVEKLLTEVEEEGPQGPQQEKEE